MNRLEVGLESFRFLGSLFLASVFGNGKLRPENATGICQLHGSDDTQFFLETSISTTDDICVASDWIVLLVQFLLLHTFSWTSRWLLWEPFARWHMGKGHGTQKRVQKFSQTAAVNVFHISSAFCAWKLLYHQDWLWHPDLWSHDVEGIVPTSFKFYYLLYAARYMSDLVSLVFEHPRSDTWAFAVHHAVSIVLVLLSAKAGHVRIGAVCMFFLDWADPFMLTAKLFRYLSKQRSDVYQWMANRLTEIFAVCFILTRNVLLSYVTWICLRDFPNSAWLLKMGMVVLVLLMTFWLYLIGRVAVRQLQNKGHVDDVRSDDESDDGATRALVARNGIARRKRKKPKNRGARIKRKDK